MKEKVTKATDVAVIVGRFQVNELHEAHIDLITSVLNKHDRVLLFLGNSTIRNTLNNPLDYRARRTMIADKFPTVEIHYINDNPSDTANCCSTATILFKISFVVNPVSLKAFVAAVKSSTA